MNKLVKHLVMLCACMMAVFIMKPLQSHAENRVISGPVEAYSSRAQECVFRLDTEHNWRAECNYSFIHLSTTTGHWGDSDLKFTIDENKSSNSRMGWIVVYDQELYYPIFTFEINQAAAGSAPPAVGPYFCNEIPALDDGYERLSWDTSSFNFKFMSNRNVTMTIDGKSVTLTKTSNSNGYTYQYNFNMGKNTTSGARSFRIEVYVDGKNVSGGNHQTYVLSQARKEVFMDNVKIIAGYVPWQEGAVPGRQLIVSYRTNDDFEIWMSWESTKTPYLSNTYKLKVGPRKTVKVSSNSYAYGESGTINIYPGGVGEFIPYYYRNVRIYLKNKNSSTVTTLNVYLDHDYGR
ncbi:MAG: BACON domain-containing protein [Lachnospiraceae bacterium]|nr:BACON domain-containing protein [Lachnospiraceae bacterium]MBR5760522.1 BACON domain-containing protein [Lachnospiraceae bacterium]